MFFEGVIVIPHLRQNNMIVAKVLHEVSIFMKDGTDDHLHIGGVVTKYIKGICVIVITTIGGGASLRKSNDPILKGPLTRDLCPDVCFAPLNCFAHNGPKLIRRKVRCLCLQGVFHVPKIRNISDMAKHNSTGGE